MRNISYVYIAKHVMIYTGHTPARWTAWSCLRHGRIYPVV